MMQTVTHATNADHHSHFHCTAGNADKQYDHDIAAYRTRNSTTTSSPREVPLVKNADLSSAAAERSPARFGRANEKKEEERAVRSHEARGRERKAGGSAERKETKSTPLHQQFLNVVEGAAMAEEIQIAEEAEVELEAPMERQGTSKKGRKTPTTGRNTPTKGRESPTKHNLEVGQNGFYYSCEMPLSKVVPKRPGTPTSRPATPNRLDSAVKESIAISESPQQRKPVNDMSPGKRTPKEPTDSASPSRKPTTPPRKVDSDSFPITPGHVVNGSPSKAVPSKPRYGTPLRKMNTPDSIKRPIGNKASPKNSRKRTTPKPSGVSNSIKTSQTKVMQGIANKENMSEQLPSGAPDTGIQLKVDASKKIHRSSQGPYDIGSLMAGLKSHASTLRDSPFVARADGTNTSAPPTPLRRAAERAGISSNSPSRVRVAQLAVRLSNGTASLHTTPFTAECPKVIHPRIEQATLSHSLALREKDPTTEVKSLSASLPFEHHGVFHNSDRSIKLPSRMAPKRAGTDPMVFLAMREEMKKIGQSMSRSVDHDSSLSETINALDLSAISDSSSTALGLATIKPKSTLARAESNVSASSPSSSGHRTLGKLRSPKKVGTSGRATGSQGTPHGGHMVAQKRTGNSDHVSGSPTVRQAKQFDNAVSTSPRSRLAPLSTKSSTSANLKSLPTPTKAATKVSGPTTQRIAQGLPKGVPAYARPTQASTASIRKPNSAMPRKGVKPNDVFPRFHSPDPDAQPPEKQFASAVDIANRVKKWNFKERKGMAPAPKLPTSATKTPTKMNLQTPVKHQAHTSAKTPSKTPTAVLKKTRTQAKDSYTPDGSPTKPATPTASPSKPPSHSPPNTKPNHGLAPKSPIQPRVIRGLNPRTPMNSKIAVMDRNAFRTPSKEIESSLDAAINRKIEEDKKRILGVEEVLEGTREV